MYGLQLNWNKLEVLPVRCEARVRTPNGDLRPLVFRAYIISKAHESAVLFAHNMAAESRIEKTQCFSIKMFEDF